MIGTRWRHVKTGGTYTVLHLARLQTQWPSTRLDDMCIMVVYVSEKDQSVWVRSLAEFTDGRFVADPEERFKLHDGVSDEKTRKLAEFMTGVKVEGVPIYDWEGCNSGILIYPTAGSDHESNTIIEVRVGDVLVKDSRTLRVEKARS